MIVFKTFLKVLKACLPVIIMYTVILIVFGAFSLSSNENTTDFSASKPDIYIKNNDAGNAVSDDLVKYMSENCNPVELKDDEEALDDALFYRDINYIIIIPENYSEDFMAGNEPQIEVNSTGDYNASLAEMMLSRYIKLADIYRKTAQSQEQLIADIRDTLSIEADVVMTTQLDTDSLGNASYFYNFANYSMLAGCVYVICMIMSSFREEKVWRRTKIASIKIKKYNFILLTSNGLFAAALCAIYILLSFIIVGEIMLSAHGILLMLNLFIFTMVALTLAFFIGNVVGNKNAINGIVNVVALGSSFLCGCFVPVQWLPDSVITLAHIFPSYYYVNSNNLICSMEKITVSSMKPVFVNTGIMFGFMILFIILSNVFSSKKG